jgi:hypothetical protein
VTVEYTWDASSVWLRESDWNYDFLSPILERRYVGTVSGKTDQTVPFFPIYLPIFWSCWMRWVQQSLHQVIQYHGFLKDHRLQHHEAFIQP